MQKSQLLGRASAALQLVLPHWKRRQRPSPVDPTRQDLGNFSDMVMDPRPMAKDRLTTIGTQGVDFLLSQAPKMNMHGVPFYYGSHVSIISH